MNTIKDTAKGIALLLAVFAYPGIVVATPVMCGNDPNINHMLVDSSLVSACLDSGPGNISGNLATDPFLQNAAAAGDDYIISSKSDGLNPWGLTFSVTTKTKDYTLGTWSLDASYWLTNNVGILGFKFGTGNNDDEWFIYQLVQGVSSGSFHFVNVQQRGGGLSHTNLYAVPEPTVVFLLGLGILALAGSRKKQLIC